MSSWIKSKGEKMMNKQTNSSTGVSFLELLQLVFITLKLLKVIDWSWWWVLSPTWGGLLLLVIFVVILWVLKAW